jgi:hypothetical protein
MRHFLRLPIFAAAVLVGVALFASAAQACPMCNQSIAEDEMLPHAFMYSILFMLGMPATVFAGFGTLLYVKFRKFHASQPIRMAGDDLVAQRPVAELELAGHA